MFVIVGVAVYIALAHSAQCLDSSCSSLRSETDVWRTDVQREFTITKSPVSNSMLMCTSRMNIAAATSDITSVTIANHIVNVGASV